MIIKKVNKTTYKMTFLLLAPLLGTGLFLSVKKVQAQVTSSEDGPRIDYKLLFNQLLSVEMRKELPT
jgi:hypothetical protein